MNGETTGDRLRNAMDERGVGVRELSRTTGLSLSCVRRLMREDMVGNLYTWRLISGALNLPIEEFMEGE